MKSKKIFAAAAACAAITLSTSAFAVSGMSVEVGNGDDVDMGRIGVQWDWQKPLLQFSSWNVGGYWDLSLGQWHQGGVASGQHSDITEVGFTPVLRVQPNGLAGPYLEAGIGAHVLSHTSIGGRNMSTAFQFGDHVGVGYRFGAKQAFDVSYRYQHLSNASFKRPNPGIGFNQIRLQYHF